jgi:hypothetical protein
LHEKLTEETKIMPRTPKQEDFLATARKSQEIMADAIRTWVETVRTATPKMSSVYAPFAERLSKVPSVCAPFAQRLSKVPSVYAPFAQRLSTAEEAVASAYDLAERLLASQRKFAEDVVRATRPLMPGFGASKPQEHSESVAQGKSEGTPEVRSEAAAQEPAAEGAPQETPAETPKAATASQSTTKTTATQTATKTTAATRTPRSTAATRTPKSAAASRTPKTTATPRAPKNSDAG